MSADYKTDILAAIQDTIHQNQSILDAFHAESDRGAILIATSFLEVALEQLLRAVFVHDCSSRLFAFEGALGTFSARIELAYAIGLIHKSTAANLNRVRRIRNVCAHSHEAVDFDRDQIRDLTHAMWSVDSMIPKEFSAAPRSGQVRAKFLMNVALIYSQLLMVLNDAIVSKREQLWYAHQLGKEQTDKTLAQLETERKANESRFAELEQHFANQEQDITRWVDSELEALAEDVGLTSDEVRKRYEALAASRNDTKATTTG